MAEVVRARSAWIGTLLLRLTSYLIVYGLALVSRLKVYTNSRCLFIYSKSMIKFMIKLLLSSTRFCFLFPIWGCYYKLPHSCLLIWAVSISV